METILRGGCLCGSVRYECSGDTEEASYCHCDDCKKATGGPYTVGRPRAGRYITYRLRQSERVYNHRRQRQEAHP